jgi:hypothetical protein
MEIPELVKLYAPISKIDEEKRMVYGYATTPSVDSQDEVIDLEASFEAVDEWKKWANIKEMHRADTAVGIAPIIEKHVGVGVYIGAEIVDDQAWKKCVKKVYKGFSIGGKVIAREGKHITKYRLNEISLVDRPANPDSMFMVAKRDDTNASATEAEGGDLVEKTETPSIPVAGEAPPKAETEAVVVKVAEVPKVETPVTETTVAPTVDYKAEFEKLQAQIQDMEKARKEQDLVADAILKAVDRLEPKVKKVHEEMVTTPKTEEEQKEEAKAAINKMSIGELTQAMFKQKPAITSSTED